MEYAAKRRRPGRPLSFERESALRQAMLAFWRYGYETTSIADLTAAMGITAPSLYTAFGDKKQLFLEATRLYAGDPAVIAEKIDAAPSAYAAAHELLSVAACAFTGEDTPSGCLLASATASGSAASADVQLAVTKIRLNVQRNLKGRIERDISEGVVSADTDTAELSGLVMAVMQGMSVLARDGASQTALLGIARAALRAWPGRLANRTSATAAG